MKKNELKKLFPKIALNQAVIVCLNPNIEEKIYGKIHMISREGLNIKTLKNIVSLKWRNVFSVHVLCQSNHVWRNGKKHKVLKYDPIHNEVQIENKYEFAEKPYIRKLKSWWSLNTCDSTNIK
jgi:hypothetical protein